MTVTTAIDLNRPTYTVAEVMRIFGASKTAIYEALARGEFATFKIGRSRRVSGESVRLKLAGE